MGRLRRRAAVLCGLSLSVILAPFELAFGQDLLNDNPTFSPFNLELRQYVQMPAGSPNIISMTTRAGESALYVTTQEGRVHKVVPNASGTGTRSEFLNLANTGAGGVTLAGTSGQQGLQSIAFHPDFDNEGMPGYGKLYATLTRAHSTTASFLGNSPHGGGTPGNPDGVLAEWTYDHANGTVSGYRELFRVNMPVSDHPIKQARFNLYAQAGDEDYGLLYMTHGDSNTQQSTEDYPLLLGNVLGKMIRINPLQSGGDRYTIPATNPFADGSDPNVLKEIYAYGFRNPHTYSFNKDDDGNVHILAGNIGRANIEEIERVLPGHNYGWPDHEGTFVHLQIPSNQPGDGYIDGVAPLPANEASIMDAYGRRNTYPVAQYDHNAMVSQISSGNAVASGFVIRNGSDPNLHIQLIFNNFASKDGVVYHADFEDMLSAVIELDPNDPSRDEPGELTRAVLHKLNLALDHDNNPATAPQIWSDFSTLLSGNPGSTTDRNDARYGEGVFGEMYMSTKQQGGRIYLVTNSLPLAGDYNKDRVVDAADHVVWRDTVGETGYHLAADGNGDAVVDASDYLVWQSNFGKVWPGSGSGTGAATAVPEPAAWLLLCAGTLALLSKRRTNSWR